MQPHYKDVVHLWNVTDRVKGIILFNPAWPRSLMHSVSVDNFIPVMYVNYRPVVCLYNYNFECQKYKN